jgi:hypothetical protein
MMTVMTFGRAFLLLAGATAAGLTPSTATGQGCEPIRFTVPVNLGAVGQAYKPSGWELTLAYRRLTSNQFFVGTEETSGPGGSVPIFKIHTVIADMAYSFNDRVRARVSVPFSTGSLERKWPDNKIHEQTTKGIGDVSVLGEAWLLSPRAHPKGNIAIGLGLKAPTGSHTKASQFYTASGPVDFPADQTIQPGDGGWGVLMQLQAFRQIVDRTSLYALGSYIANPKARTDATAAPSGPNSIQHWAVPDVYSARAGVAFEVLPEQGLSMSLGARVDGIPVHDLIGAGDEDTIKRTSYIVFADPGISYARDKNTLTLSVPWRMHLNRMTSLADRAAGVPSAGGGFAKYLVFASYTRRF